MLKKIIQEYQTLLEQQPIAIAVSGGVDSMVLTHLLSDLGLDFTGLHCNFNLRSVSEQDAAFVKKEYEKINRSLVVRSFETIQEKHKNETAQMAARRLRYDWFKEWQKKTGGIVLMGHHLDDRIETFWLNLSRGTSIIGLQGMPERNNNFLRPLLEASKADIKSYAKKNNIAFVEDESNYSDDYQRNWIRHHFVDCFEGATSEEWKLFFARQNKINTWLEEKVRLLNKQFISNGKGNVQINKELFKQPWIWGYHSLKRFGLKRKHEAIFNDINQMETGKSIDFENYKWHIEENHVIVSTLADEQTIEPVSVSRGQNEISFGDFRIEWGYCDQENVDFTLNDTIYVSADKIELPIFMRSFEAGDKIQPIGMKGQKKVSDLINEKKIRGSDKKQVPVLCFDNKVVAVLPWRVSERFKIEENTQEIIFFRLKNLEINKK